MKNNIASKQQNSYEAYKFISYTEFKGNKYVSKTQLDKWIEYNA